MENLMNTHTTGALYVHHFNMALVNFEKLVKEERRFRRLSRNARKHGKYKHES